MFGFSKRAAAQLKDQARNLRRLVRNDDAFALGAGDAQPVIRSPNTQWLRITSSTAKNGYYPALVQASAVGGDLDGVTKVWLAFPAGYQPTASDVSGMTLFLGRQDADNNGQPAFTAPDCVCQRYYQPGNCCPECMCADCNGNFASAVSVVIPAGFFAGWLPDVQQLEGSSVDLLWQGPQYLNIDTDPCYPLYQSADFIGQLFGIFTYYFTLSCSPDLTDAQGTVYKSWVLTLIRRDDSQVQFTWYLPEGTAWLCNTGVSTLQILGGFGPGPITLVAGPGNNTLPAPALPDNLFLTLDAPCPGSWELMRLPPQVFPGPPSGTITSIWSSSGDLVIDTVVISGIPITINAPSKAFCNDGVCEYGAVLSCFESGYSPWADFSGSYGPLPLEAFVATTYQLTLFSRLINAPHWTAVSATTPTGLSCIPIFWIYDYRHGGSGLTDCGNNPINFRGIVTA